MSEEDEIARLRRDCSEAYQAVGILADELGYWSPNCPAGLKADITKLLDNLGAATSGEPRPHADLLPFGQWS